MIEVGVKANLDGLEARVEQEVSKFGQRTQSPAVDEGPGQFLDDLAGGLDAEGDRVDDDAGEGVGGLVFPPVVERRSVGERDATGQAAESPRPGAAVHVAREEASGRESSSRGLEVAGEATSTLDVAQGEVADEDDVGGGGVIEFGGVGDKRAEVGVAGTPSKGRGIEVDDQGNAAGGCVHEGAGERAGAPEVLAQARRPRAMERDEEGREVRRGLNGVFVEVEGVVHGRAADCTGGVAVPEGQVRAFNSP